MSGQKRIVLERFVELLAEYISLEKAMLATLGGQGLEAEIWRTSGVSPERIYLVERNPSRMKRLIRDHRPAQHVCASLSSFPGVFRAKHGNRAGLDLFHCDLCGTIEPVIRDLTGVLPLIAQSQGKCLAVTVADQRRNRSSENPRQLFERAERVFGHRGSELFARLLDFHTAPMGLPFGQNADPRKVALRELGVMTCLAEAFASALPGKAMLPDRLVRFMYSSGGFRMRSYFWHFGKEGSAEQLAQTMADLIAQAPIYWVDGDRLVKMEHAKERKMHAKNEAEQILERLGPLLQQLSEVAVRDIRKLAELASQGPDVALVRRAVELLSQAMARGSGPVSSEDKPEPQSGPIAPEPVKPTPASQAKKTGYQPSQKVYDQDEWRLELYRAAAKGDEAFQQKWTEVLSKLKVPKGKDGQRMLLSIMARGRGKFRSEFLARILLSRESGQARRTLLEELVTIFKEPAEKLLGQAKQTTFWRRQNA